MLHCSETLAEPPRWSSRRVAPSVPPGRTPPCTQPHRHRRPRSPQPGPGPGRGLHRGRRGAPPGDGALREVAASAAIPASSACWNSSRTHRPPAHRWSSPCTAAPRSAGGYDRGSGWSVLAARQGFALLLPEQRTANNANRCFNWFEPGDTHRDRGEAASIRQMVAHMVSRHRLDPQRVFVTGLSAGGAMTSVMLATYPEVFAAGAILAGLPYGAAQSMPEAFEAMATGRPRPAAERAAAVRAASPHRGPWPRVAVWHGDADSTVRPANAAEILKQWQRAAWAGRGTRGRRGAGPGASAGALARRGWHAAGRAPRHRRHGPWRADRPRPGGCAARRGGALHPRCRPVLNRGDRRLLRPGRSSAPGGVRTGAPAEAAEAPRDAEAPGWLDRIIAIGRDGIAQVTTAGAARSSQPGQPAPQPGSNGAAPLARQLLSGEPAPRDAAPEQPKAAPEPPAATGRTNPGQVIRRALRAAGLLDR